jgi:heme exporter protein B
VSAPSLSRAAMLIAAKDLKLEWRTWESLAASIVFSVTVLIVFQFAFGEAATRTLGVPRLVPGVIWALVGFVSVVVLAGSMQGERHNDTLAALVLAPVDRGAIFLGKFAANLIKLSVLQWLVVPLTAVIYDYRLLPVAPTLLLILFVHGLGLALLGTLFAAVTTRVQRGDALLATLLLPAATPLLISAVRCTSATLAGEPFDAFAHWLAAAVGFDLLYLFIGLLTFEFILEE